MDESNQETDDISNNWFIGEPIRVNYDVVWDGVWQLSEEATAKEWGTQPGFVKIKDINGDGVINADDRTIIGQQDPKFMWGLNNTFTYKNLYLSIFMHGVHGVTMLNTEMADNVMGREVRYNTLKKNWWTPDNPSNEWVMNQEDANQMNGFTGRIYENADFIRIKDISLGYTFPSSFFNNHISDLRLYLSGSNLFTFTKWTGLDPELTAPSEQADRPFQKEFTVGLNISF